MPNRFRKLWAIGDIHGDNLGFGHLINEMFYDGMDLNQDLLVFIGDLVDGFRHSKQVIQSVRFYQSQYPNTVVVLRGNHEQLMLDGARERFHTPEFQLWFRQGGQATAESYGPIRQTAMYPDHMNMLVIPEQMRDDMTWMETLPLTYETDDYIFVHAGLRPPFPVSEQDPHDLLWIRNEFYDVDYDFGKRVVYGHTARKAPRVQRNSIGIDTRWRGRGYITGVQLFAKHEEPRFYKPPQNILDAVNASFHRA